MTSSGWVGHGIGRAILRAMARSAERQPARVSGNDVIFSCSRLAKIVLGLCVASLWIVAALMAVMPGPPRWIVVMFVAIGFLVFLGWPRTITVTPSGIEQRWIFGGRREIPWRNLTALEFRQNDLMTTAQGSDGKRIVFSPYHVDRMRFHAEVVKRSGMSSILQTV